MIADEKRCKHENFWKKVLKSRLRPLSQTSELLEKYRERDHATLIADVLSCQSLECEPTELLSRLEQLKIVLTSDQNLKELLSKPLFEMKNDDVSPKDSETVPSCVESSSTAESFNNPLAGSSINLKKGNLSCSFQSNVSAVTVE